MVWLGYRIDPAGEVSSGELEPIILLCKHHWRNTRLWLFILGSLERGAGEGTDERAGWKGVEIYDASGTGSVKGDSRRGCCSCVQ